MPNLYIFLSLRNILAKLGGFDYEEVFLVNSPALIESKPTALKLGYRLEIFAMTEFECQSKANFLYRFCAELSLIQKIRHILICRSDRENF